MKSSEVSFKTRSTPASLSFKGQVTKHTTVKCSINDNVNNQLLIRTSIILNSFCCHACNLSENID